MAGRAEGATEAPGRSAPEQSEDPTESAFLSRLLSDKALAREKPTLEVMGTAPKPDDGATEYLATLRLETG